MSAKAGIDGGLKELVALNIVGKKIKNKSCEPHYSGFVYVRSDKIKSHWRKSSEKTLHKLFDDKEKDGSGSLRKELAEKFKQKIKDKFKKEDVLWGSEEEKDLLAPVKKFNTEKGKGSKTWNFSAGAQFLRYSAGMCLKSEINFADPKLSIEFAGSTTFALAEGKTKAHWYIPEKNGVDIVRLLIDADRKVQKLLNPGGVGPGKQPVRTVLKPDQRNMYLRLIIGFEGTGFAGATAAFTFPRLELKPTNEPVSKDSKRLALASLEGGAFAGAQAEGKLTGSTEWKESQTGKEWRMIASVEGGLAGSAGIGGEAKLHFGYEKGHVRFRCSLQAVFIVGGKTFWDFDLGLIATLDFLAELARRVDYHYVAEIAGDLYEVLGAYKYALLMTPHGMTLLGGLYALKEIDHSVETAKDFVNKTRETFQQVTAFVDKNIVNPQFKVEREQFRYIDAQVEKIRQSPPETVARFLLAVMKTVEPEDYIYITKILDATESDHELRWLIRYFGLLVHLHELQQKNPGAPAITYKGVTLRVKDKTVIASNEELQRIMKAPRSNGKGLQKDEEFEDGVRKLLEFGNYRKDNEVKMYIAQLTTTLRKNGISYA